MQPTIRPCLDFPPLPPLPLGAQAEYGNSLIRRITVSSALVSTLAGGQAAGTVTGHADGIGTSATFLQPVGIAMDPSGTIALVGEQGNNIVRKIIISSAAVSTLAGTCCTAGHADGTGSAASFSSPHGLAIDAAISFAVLCDMNNGLIRRIDLGTGAVTTLVGNQASPGNADGVGTAASFKAPHGLAMDAAGTFVLVVSGAARGGPCAGASTLPRCPCLLRPLAGRPDQPSRPPRRR